MPLIFAFIIALLLAMIAYHLFNRIPPLPQTVADWGSDGGKDPRVAVAAMMYAVATEDGPLTGEEERHILSLLCSEVGLDPILARTCLTGGTRMARRLRGTLNSRLHQLIGPIERNCGPQEKQDVLDMLHSVAGSSAERLGPVREGLGRLSASLLQG